MTNYRDAVAVDVAGRSPDTVRRMRLTGVVDTGAAKLVLPLSAIETLGLLESGEIGVRFADGRRAQRKVVSDVQLQIGDRVGIFSAIVEPGREDALIGAIVLEELDLIPDCTAQKLVPRDPKGLLAEIE